MNKKRIVIISTIFIVIVIVLLFGTTYAKYKAESIWNYYLETKEFYFSSDKLGIEPIENVDNQWDGESVYFSLKNSDNNDDVTNFDIKYNVTCETNNGSSCSINGSNDSSYEGILSTYNFCENSTNDGVDTTSFNKVECEVNGYSWKNAPAIKELYFDIIDDTLDSVEVTITATSIEPYKKKIVGKFLLTKDKNLVGNISMDYKSYTNNDNLIISNSYDEDKCIKLSWDANNLRIDEDEFISSKADSNGYINEIIAKIGSKDTINYTFYKTDDKKYSTNDFNLTKIECSN